MLTVIISTFVVFFLLKYVYKVTKKTYKIFTLIIVIASVFIAFIIPFEKNYYLVSVHELKKTEDGKYNAEDLFFSQELSSDGIINFNVEFKNESPFIEREVGLDYSKEHPYTMKIFEERFINNWSKFFSLSLKTKKRYLIYLDNKSKYRMKGKII